jgi:predicted lipoprotein with Yx(FWY)xxD motif
MNGSQHKRVAPSPRERGASSLAARMVAVTLALTASLAAIALAGGRSVTVTSASNSMLGAQIVVDAQGRTLYALSPETAHHLLCKSHACLTVWRPLTVRSSRAKLKAGSGVRGRLAILHRSQGVLQVTLGGLPLYHFAGDGAKGEANGQHIHSFGGTWHVLSAASNAGPAPTTPNTPTKPSPLPGY